jgi:hypothetical protein
MDIRSEVENEKFLRVCGRPYKGVCNCLTLRSGVITVAVLDMILAVINFIGLTLLINDFYLYRVYLAYYTRVFTALANLVTLPFAFLGMMGMTRIKPENVAIYSRYKIVEFFVISFLVYLQGIADNPQDTALVFISIIISSASRLVAALIVKIVWSADIRLRYNETMLVVHGEEALKLMQQQAINLADPRVITPGSQIYIAPPFEQS